MRGVREQDGVLAAGGLGFRPVGNHDGATARRGHRDGAQLPSGRERGAAAAGQPRPLDGIDETAGIAERRRAVPVQVRAQIHRPVGGEQPELIHGGSCHRRASSAAGV